MIAIMLFNSAGRYLLAAHVGRPRGTNNLTFQLAAGRRPAGRTHLTHLAARGSRRQTERSEITTLRWRQIRKQLTGGGAPRPALVRWRRRCSRQQRPGRCCNCVGRNKTEMDSIRLARAAGGVSGRRGVLGWAGPAVQLGGARQSLSRRRHRRRSSLGALALSLNNSRLNARHQQY
jgi:hypothetical protein